MILALHMGTVNCFNSPKSITCSSPMAFILFIYLFLFFIYQWLLDLCWPSTSRFLLIHQTAGVCFEPLSMGREALDLWFSAIAGTCVLRLANQLEPLAPLCRSWATQVYTPVIFLGQESVLAFWNMVKIFKLTVTNWHGVAHEGWMWEKKSSRLSRKSEWRIGW